MSTDDTDQPVVRGTSGRLTTGIKRKKWYVHVDTPWTGCKAENGEPHRIYITTPWIFITIGEKSQRWTPKGGYSKTKWDWISFRPIH